MGCDHICHHRTCNGVSTIPAITEHALGCRSYLPSQGMQWDVNQTGHHRTCNAVSTTSASRTCKGCRSTWHQTCNGVWAIPATTVHAMECRLPSQDMQGVSIIPAIRHAKRCRQYRPSQDMQWDVDHTCHHRTCNGVLTIPAITGHSMGCQP